MALHYHWRGPQNQKRGKSAVPACTKTEQLMQTLAYWNPASKQSSLALEFAQFPSPWNFWFLGIVWQLVKKQELRGRSCRRRNRTEKHTHDPTIAQNLEALHAAKDQARGLKDSAPQKVGSYFCWPHWVPTKSIQKPPAEQKCVWGREEDISELAYAAEESL